MVLKWLACERTPLPAAHPGGAGWRAVTPPDIPTVALSGALGGCEGSAYVLTNSGTSRLHPVAAQNWEDEDVPALLTAIEEELRGRIQARLDAVSSIYC